MCSHESPDHDAVNFSPHMVRGCFGSDQITVASEFQVMSRCDPDRNLNSKLIFFGRSCQECSTDASGVFTSRIATRRIREVLPLIQERLQGGRRSLLARQADGAALGSVRDADVRIVVSLRHPARASPRPRRPSFSSVSGRSEKAVAAATAGEAPRAPGRRARTCTSYRSTRRGSGTRFWYRNDRRLAPSAARPRRRARTGGA